ISGQRLLLRNIQMEDLPHFLAYRQLPEVCRYQGFNPFTQQQAMDFIQVHRKAQLGQVGEWMQIGIELKAKAQLIGDCGLRFQKAAPKIIDLGYTIHPTFQQRGLATEALRLLLSEVFQKYEVHKANALIDPRNIGSIKLVEKLGFQREAHFRQSYFDELDQAWTDEYQYGLLANEFLSITRSEA
ncbi:MAG: GNAT family N-acetyltransferase, partial [Bacteroidota bacterium]